MPTKPETQQVGSNNWTQGGQAKSSDATAVLARFADTPASKTKTAMRKFIGTIQTDVQGSEVEFEFEVGGDATQDQINEEAQQAAFDCIQWSFEEVK